MIQAKLLGPQAGSLFPLNKDMPTQLRYGQVQLSAMNWPFYVAQEQRFFAEEDLVVQARIFTSPPEPVAELINGALDVISVIPDVTLLEIEKGASLSLIASINPRPQYRLLVQPEVRDFHGLKGRRIGVNDVRSAESLIIQKLLREKSLPPESYELTAAGPPSERCEKLERGLLAATMVTQPFDLMLEERGFYALTSSREIVPHYPFTMGVVRQEDRINEGILAFLKCVKMAWQWLADPTHRGEASAILSHYTKAGEKQAEGTYDLYLNPPSPPGLAANEKGVTTILELLAEGGRISTPIAPAQKYIDQRYLNRLEQH